MSVQGWKWWQWLIVSLVVGGIVGLVLTTRDIDDPSLPSLSVGNFLNKLRLRTDKGEPVVTKIRVSPVTADNEGKPTQVVTFWERLKNKETGSWDPVRQYRVYTTIPVFPKAPRANYGISDYLADQKKDFPALDTGFNWWQVPRNAWLMSMGGSVLLIGVVWPQVIRMLVKMGLGNPEVPQEAGYDLSKVQQRPTERPAAPVATEEDAAELAAFNAQLESKVGGMKIVDEKRDETEERRQEQAVIRKLSDAPLERQDADKKPDEEKTFGGEYYPVARPGTRDA